MSTCPHCSKAVEAGTAYCPSCGKAVTAGSGPRIIEGEALASTSTGLALQSENLLKQTRKTFGRPRSSPAESLATSTGNCS